MRVLKNLNEENLIFFDIETARVEKDLIIDSPLYNSWEYKVNKSGEMTSEEIIQSYINESGLYPEFAKIITIVVGKIIDGKITLITFNDEDEKELLTKFNKLLNRRSGDTLIGFVNIGFDTPFIFKRMLINGIIPNDKVDSSGLKPWEVEEIDLSKLWQATSFNRASLINIATAFGLPSPKDDISGADVGNVYWDEDKGLDRIAKYCRKDVVTTINIFRKMKLEEPLELSNPDVDIEFEEEPLIIHLFNGGDYGNEEKSKLKELLDSLSQEDRDKAFVILNAMVSGAKGKKTKITKRQITALSKTYV